MVLANGPDSCEVGIPRCTTRTFDFTVHATAWTNDCGLYPSFVCVYKNADGFWSKDTQSCIFLLIQCLVCILQLLRNWHRFCGMSILVATFPSERSDSWPARFSQNDSGLKRLVPLRIPTWLPMGGERGAKVQATPIDRRRPPPLVRATATGKRHCLVIH